MTGAQWREFVLGGTRTGKLATNRKDGRPHVTPVWFLLDEEEGEEQVRVVFNTGQESLKFKALSREPRFSLCVDDQEPPFAFVMLECTAEFTDDPELMRQWATRIGGRYMGAENAEAYGKRNSVPGEYLVRARVDRVVAFAGIAE
ncbi:PPOX class F420-dependent oxidoreductase [Streptomyces sp. NPDC087440]|uniref:PPOX class F420-dependent oxidoreductase n=1 Tax=Streptomyces sp. NPDC087440 TaxID=3365790 RepID=UPI0037F945CC